MAANESRRSYPGFIGVIFEERFLLSESERKSLRDDVLGYITASHDPAGFFEELVYSAQSLKAMQQLHQEQLPVNRIDNISNASRFTSKQTELARAALSPVNQHAFSSIQARNPAKDLSELLSILKSEVRGSTGRPSNDPIYFGAYKVVQAWRKFMGKDPPQTRNHPIEVIVEAVIFAACHKRLTAVHGIIAKALKMKGEKAGGVTMIARPERRPHVKS